MEEESMPVFPWIWLSMLWILSAGWGCLMQYNWMPFCGAFLAAEPGGFGWFLVALLPQHRQAVCVCAPGAQQQPGCAFPAARQGFLPCSFALSLITCRIRCVPFQPPAQLLWRAVSLLSSVPHCSTAQHVNLCSTELCHLKACGFFLFPLSGCFFSLFFCQENCFLGENSLFLIQLQVVNYLRLTKSNWF